MYFLLSPAKTLDFDSPAPVSEYSQAIFLDKAEQLADRLKSLSADDIQKLMGVSDKIAALNVKRNQEWALPFSQQNAKQAMFAFKGDVYTGLAVDTAGQQEIDYLSSRVLILSGLYGLLRPLDLMMPYRLEMGTKLANPKGSNLYEFWGDSVTERINELVGSGDGEAVLNLASNEYFKVINNAKLRCRLITPVFKDTKNGKLKIISFYAKKARGLMVRYAADKQLSRVEDLKGFDYAGYQYTDALSSDSEWVFTRDEQ